MSKYIHLEDLPPTVGQEVIYCIWTAGRVTSRQYRHEQRELEHLKAPVTGAKEIG